MAVVSFALAFTVAPLAPLFGHIARKQIRERGEGGDALAIAGLIIGYTALIPLIVVILTSEIWLVVYGGPRFWANFLGRAIDGSALKGTVLGLLIGFVCTAVPLLLLALAARWSRRNPAVGAICILTACIVAIPNLITASIAAGFSNTAKAGQYVIYVDAPMFRGATLCGSIIGAIVALAAVIPIVVRRRSQAADKAAAKQAKADIRAEKRGGD